MKFWSIPMKLYKWLFLLSWIPAVVFSQITILKQSPSMVVLEFQLKNLQETVTEINGIDYYHYQFEDGVIEEEFGNPGVPHFQTRLAIPLGAKISFQMTSLTKEARQNAVLMPQGFLDFPEKDIAQIQNSEVYGTGVPYPQAEIILGEPYDFRGVNVVPLKIYPIQFFPANREVQINSRIQVRFQFQGGQTSPEPITFNSIDKSIFEEKIANHQQVSLYALPTLQKFQKTQADYDLSVGRWFRIPITDEGIYQITGSFLESNGVNISTIQLGNISMYNYGGYALPYSVNSARPADLNEIAVEIIDNNQDGVMNQDDAVRFYGKGLGGWVTTTNNGKIGWKYYGNPDGSADQLLFPYDDTNYYLLNIDGLAGKRITTETSPQNPNPVRPASFTDYHHFEVDEHNILSSGLSWYWLKMTGVSDNKSTSFVLPQNIANDTVNMNFRFHGGSGSLYGTTEIFRYTLKTIVNSRIILDNIFFTNNVSVSRAFQENTSVALRGGANLLEIEHSGNLDGCEVYLDYFDVIFRRPFIAESGILRFRDELIANSAVEYQISSLPSGQNQIWDISDYANIRRIEPIQNGSSMVFQDFSSVGVGKYYYVYSPGSIRNVGAIEAVENRPNLRNPARRAEFIIITPPEFYEQAEFLEVWRESQIPDPMETERVSLDQIFLEFSSSVRDVTAIRDFIHYAYDNWGDTLRYVLLFGDGHYDYRGIRLTDTPNLIPPFEITSNGEIDNRETDNYYVALGMNGDLRIIDPTLAIARLPFANVEQIEIYRDKAEKYQRSYLNDPERNGWQVLLTFVSDDETGGPGSNHELSYHLKPTEDIVKSYIPEKFNISKIYLHDYDKVPGGLGRWKPKATEDLVNQINRGTLMINYFGHGDPDTWAHESILNRARDLPKFQNDYRLPVWVAATCTWGKFDNPSRPSMSEELIWLSEKGGIAVISASRPVYVSGNTKFTSDFYRQLFNNSFNYLHSKSLGDAMLLALSYSENYQKYHMYGDPTQKLADPERNIQIMSIEPDTLRALSTVNVTARITEMNGNPATNFEGTAVIQVFDATDKESVTDGSIQYNYEYNGGTIFKGLVSVLNGELTGRFIVPKSIKYDPDPSGRLSIYAWSDNQGDAAGYSDTLILYGSESQIDDQKGPDIEVAFKDNPNFFEGDFVSNQPTLQVDLYDDSGINLTGEVGHKIELVINENMKKDITEFFVYEKDSYKKGKLEYTLPALTSGSHQLKLSAWDNLNNYTEKLISFRTSAANELMVTEVVNFPNPFSDRTQFTFQLISPIGSADATISIYTVTGRKIYEIRDAVQQGFNKIPRDGWDGRDWDGDFIANGVYLYKVKIDDGTSSVEQIEKLAIVR
jgi:hypothetical protein